MTELDRIFSGEGGLAVKLLKQFGVNGSLTIKDDTTYDPKNGDEISTTGISYSCQVTPPLQYKTKDIDGTNILKTDTYCFVSPVDLENIISTITPEQLNHSKVKINNICYSIISIQSYFSGTLNAAFLFQLRELN